MEISTPEQIPIMVSLLTREAENALKNGQKLYFEYGTEKIKKSYTNKQRSALHVFCREYAKALNDAGFLRRKISIRTDEILEVDWTEEAFKEDVYKVILKALSGKGSTERQSTVEPSVVADHINRHFGETKGITVAWPSLRSP
jgi:hypothetical protein